MKLVTATLYVAFEPTEEMTANEAFGLVINAKIEIEKMAYRGLQVVDLEIDTYDDEGNVKETLT
jgi:hypothetical protein